MNAEREFWSELDDNPERKRQPGGYIWRERLEDADTIILDLLVAEADEQKRAKLRKVLDILKELQRYKGG